MLHPRKPLLDALTLHRAAFLAEIDRQVSAHEQHARTTSSEAAYDAASKMARTLRAARAHLASDDVDAVCSDLSAWVMTTGAAERVARMTRYSAA